MQHVSRAVGVPLHHQVTEIIRDGIATGQYGVGSLLPTENALCDLLSVSKITVRRGLAALESAGLIERRQGKGTWVRLRPGDVHDPVVMSGFPRHLADVIATTTPRLLDFRLLMPSNDVRERLKLTASEQTLRVIRMRTRAGFPILHATAYLRSEMAAVLDGVDFSEAFSAIMVRHGHHYRRVSYSTGAVLAGPLIAPDLGVPVGSPLLELRRLAFDQDGQPFEDLRVLAPPDRYRFEIEIEDDDAEGLRIIVTP